jgi:hypothetical protein
MVESHSINRAARRPAVPVETSAGNDSHGRPLAHYFGVPARVMPGQKELTNTSSTLHSCCVPPELPPDVPGRDEFSWDDRHCRLRESPIKSNEIGQVGSR